MLFYPVRFDGLPRARPGAARTLLPRSIQQIPGVMQGGVGWQGIIPSRAAKMGSIAVDKGIAKLGSPADFYKQLEPDKIAEHILATARARHPRRGRADHGARAPAAVGRPAAARARGRPRARRRSSFPTSSATVTDEIGENIDQLLDIKLMVIRHIEEHPELANGIFLEVGQQGAPLHDQLRLLLRLPARHPVVALDRARLPHWWVLPIFGVIVGYVTNLLGDLDDLRAGRAAEDRAASGSRGCSCGASRRSRRSTRRSSPTTSSRSRTSATSCCTARAPTAPG